MDINYVIGALIAAAATVIVGYLAIKRRDHETEVKNEILHTELKGEIAALKAENKALIMRVTKLEENDKRLLNIEKILIKLEKDIEYMKKGK